MSEVHVRMKVIAMIALQPISSMAGFTTSAAQGHESPTVPILVVHFDRKLRLAQMSRMHLFIALNMRQVCH